MYFFVALAVTNFPIIVDNSLSGENENQFFVFSRVAFPSVKNVPWNV